MKTEINIENSRGYATEANLRRALARTGLDNHGARFMIVRKPSNGSFTAIFMVSEWMNKNGGYIGFASTHGFVSV
jgi:hypothetical protein